MNKRLTVIIVIILGFFLIIYFYSKGSISSFSIEVGDGEEIVKYERLQKDMAYVFHKHDMDFAILVNSNKHINTIPLINNTVVVSPYHDEKLKFQITLKDTLDSDLDIYETKAKIFAVSDIEGNFDVFSNLLINNKVIRKDLSWIFGKGHLVLNGDFFDRGNHVTEVLWLIYKLEQEAEKEGGKVHFILGNHEEMNLRGYVKYVHRKYVALADKLNIPYKELYGMDTELGRWLRTKNALVKINNNIFCHAGISPEFLKKKLSIQKTNDLIRRNLGRDKRYVSFLDSTAGFLFGREGVMWYRGYFGDYKEYYKKITEAELDDILSGYDVQHIIVGHSVVEEVQTLFDNKVIAIDAMSKDDPRREDDDNMAISCEGLLIDGDSYYRILFDSERKLLFKDNM